MVSIGIYFYELSMEKKFLASTKTILYQWKHLNFLASKPIMEADLTIHLNLVGDYPLAADLVYLYTAAAMGGQSNLLGFYNFSSSVECLLYCRPAAACTRMLKVGSIIDSSINRGLY